MKYIKLFENWIYNINEGIPLISKENPKERENMIMRNNELKSSLSKFDEYQKTIQQAIELLLKATPSSNTRNYSEENNNYYKNFISVVINTIQRLRGKYQVGNSVSPMAWHDMFNNAKKIPLSAVWIKRFNSYGSKPFSWGNATENNLAELLGHYLYMRICGINIMKNIIHSMIDNNTIDTFLEKNYTANLRYDYSDYMEFGSKYFNINSPMMKFVSYDTFSTLNYLEQKADDSFYDTYINTMNTVSTRIDQLERESPGIYTSGKDVNKLCAIFFISEFYGYIASNILAMMNLSVNR